MSSDELFRSKLADLKMTDDEIKRFSEALKKEEFRKLLVDYANEISDPANRKLYEEEITRLENDRGVDVTFINPEPGYVLKSTQNGSTKCFINICQNANIGKPSSEVNSGVKKGITWNVPHSCSPPREDIDNKGRKCMVYDVVFNPDSYRMGETNTRFRALLTDSACDTIEKNFNVKLDRANMKELKMKFKGQPVATVIRRSKTGASVSNAEPQEDIFAKVKTPYSYPPENTITKPSSENSKDVKEVKTEAVDAYTTPKYSIIHRGNMDIQDCAIELKEGCVSATRPRELVVEIELPLCKSAAQVNLDIFEKRLVLESHKPNYRLDLSLGYPVDENEGSAKFDKAKKKLVVTLPVIPFKLSEDEQKILSENFTQHVEELNVETIDTPPASPVVDVAIEDCEKKLVEEVKRGIPQKFDILQNREFVKLRLFNVGASVENANFEISVKDSAFSVRYESCGVGCFLSFYEINVDFGQSYFNCGEKFDIGLLKNSSVEIRIKRSGCTGGDVGRVRVWAGDEKDFKEVDVVRCDEEMVKEALAQIDAEEKTCAQKSVKFTVGKRDGEELTLTFDDGELDEDDDRDDDGVEREDRDREECGENDEESSLDVNNDDNVHSSCDDKEMRKRSDSSVSSDASSSKLKGILKKPRSVSECDSHDFEDNSMSSGLSGSSENNLDSSNGIKKSVSFNKQIEKNVFKPGSSCVDMRKKTNMEKNRKRNVRRKRNNSEQSNDGSTERVRQSSESTDEAPNANNKKAQKDFLKTNDANCNNNNNLDSNKSCSDDEKSSGKNANKKKQKKKKNNKDKDGGSSSSRKVANCEVKNDAAVDDRSDKENSGSKKQQQQPNGDYKNPMEIDTMLSWKAQNGLSDTYVEKTKCAFKFTNSIINELDD